MSSQVQTGTPQIDPFERVFKSLLRALSRSFGPDAEDMAQEIILLALQKYPAVRQDEPALLKVCFTTMTFKKLEEIRRRCRAKRETAADGWEPPDPRPGADRRILEDERYRRLETGVQSLSERCRTIIAMRLDEIKTPEIAQSLRISVETLHTAESRCYQKLREATSRMEKE